MTRRCRRELSEVAFKLKPGEISKIVVLANNHYILKVEARQGGDLKPAPMKDVRPEIEARLHQEQAQELQKHWIASLRSKRLHQDLLASVFARARPLYPL